jgi:hypothetical protein
MKIKANTTQKGLEIINKIKAIINKGITYFSANSYYLTMNERKREREEESKRGRGQI